MRGCLGALAGVVVGLVLSVVILYFTGWGRGDPAPRWPTPTPIEVRITEVKTTEDAYQSYVAYVRRAMNPLRVKVQPFDQAVVKFVKEDVWHFTLWYDVIGADGKAIRFLWDGDYRLLPNGDWKPA